MRTLILMLIFIAGCDSSQPPVEPAGATQVPEPMTTDQAFLWSGSCAQCHVSGNAGAPVSGDTAAWQPRMTKGRETLLEHTIAGFKNMPPLGYCMACEEADFVTMIESMAGTRLTD